MRLTEIDYEQGLPVDGYGPGFFRIAGDLVEGAVLVSLRGVSSWGGFDDIAPLLALAGKVDVLFIGTGADTAHLPGPLKDALAEAGIAAEAMASAPAARTYNVLLSEGRRVAVALLPV